MSTIDVLPPVNPYANGPAEPNTTTHDSELIDSVRKAAITFGEIQENLEELGEDLNQTFPSYSPLLHSSVKIDRKKLEEEEEELPELTKKQINTLYKICQLMQKLHLILTNLNIQNSDIHFKDREAQEAAYKQQKSTHTTKAWFVLGGGTLGGVVTAASGAFGDTVKGIMEAVGKALPSVGQFFATLKDGDIQGMNAFHIRDAENTMQKTKEQMSQTDRTSEQFWRTLDSILQSTAQVGDLAARGS